MQISLSDSYTFSKCEFWRAQTCLLKYGNIRRETYGYDNQMAFTDDRFSEWGYRVKISDIYLYLYVSIHGILSNVFKFALNTMYLKYDFEM